ncbi:transposable element Tcb1 transposase [Trichonephila clavipes]|nr:transposable element Tcb1 transposase [Trichonephila clavipes]
MAVTNRSVSSRTVAQHIESVTHHSVSARIIRRRLQQSGLSARRPLLGLPLTQNYRRLRHQWCDERSVWVAEWNEVDFTDESRICLQHHDGRVSELILTSHCSATRGLLATDHVILNHGQVTWTTPELAPPSPNYHTTPTGGRFSSRQI